ncbi:MAG: hypothetical protein HDKAJFGB_03424 [Anaerolineae bacterium]|nr:hypothetical protein [Anaerolineae bacterium]
MSYATIRSSYNSDLIAGASVQDLSGLCDAEHREKPERSRTPQLYLVQELCVTQAR